MSIRSNQLRARLTGLNENLVARTSQDPVQKPLEAKVIEGGDRVFGWSLGTGL